MKASELYRGLQSADGTENSLANETEELPSGLSFSKPVLYLPVSATVISDRSLRFLHHFFPGTSLKDWNNW